MQDDDDGSTKDVTVSNDGDQSTDDKRDTSIRDKEDDEAQKEDNQSNDIHKKSPNDDESVNPEENSSDRVDSNDGQKGVDNGDIVLQMDDMEGSKDGEDEESSQDPEDENSETSGEHALEDFWSKNTPPPAYRGELTTFLSPSITFYGSKIITHTLASRLRWRTRAV